MTEETTGGRRTADDLEDELVGKVLRLEPERRQIVLSTHDLTKRFGQTLAVDRLNLTVHRGDVFGFLGPNGAGKTTTIRMICGLIYPTSGYATVVDHRVPADKTEALRHIGGFVEVPAFYANLSARRNLRLMGSLNGEVTERRIDEVLDIVGLRERADSKIGDYSHGMKQRLGIANALINEPELVVLDEPTSGLDPQGMKDVRELVRELGHGGTTVFLSSHLLHEVEQVCNRAAILNRGRVVVEGPVSELHPEHSSVKLLTSDQVKARGVVARLMGDQEVEVDEEYLIVQASDDAVREIIKGLVAAGIGIDAVIPAREQGLEDFFLGLTQSSDVDQAGAAGVAGGAR